jgi:hypothetical protein
VLILSSAVAKKLVRGSRWRRNDFFLGVELSLAAMAAGLTNFLELSKAARASGGVLSPEKTASTAVFIVLCFLMLLVVLSAHQDWERRPQSPVQQLIWLGVVCNLIGGGLMIVFILYVKGLEP